MLRYVVAACVALAPAATLAQSSGHVPLPYNDATLPSVSTVPYPINFMPYIPKGDKGPQIARLVDVDYKNQMIRDYLVMTDQPSDASNFVGILQQCSAQGQVSEMLVDNVVDSSRFPRSVKVINCSKTALDEGRRLQQLEIAQRYYARNLTIDRPDDRRAVQAAFDAAIDATK